MIVQSYRVLQHLSIDIAFGAVILLHFFSGAYDVLIDWPVYVLLASSVWLIYTIDHLRDAKKATSSNRERYVFHSAHAGKLKVGIVLVLIGSFACLLFLPKTILIAGSILSLFCLGYIYFQSHLAHAGWKEFYVSLVYTLGILLVPFVAIQRFDFYLFIMLLILSFLNLAIFSWFERTEDEADNFKSIATFFGQTKLETIILMLLALGLAIAIAGLAKSLVYSGYFVLVMIIFSLLVLNPVWAKKDGRYRTIGDGVFLLPILFELL